jgi:hypothetical protein
MSILDLLSCFFGLLMLWAVPWIAVQSSSSRDTFDQSSLYRIRQTSIHCVITAVEDALQMSNKTESLLNDLPHCLSVNDV